MKKLRWDCPTGDHPGRLGPRRMRRDDARRYCLECTAATGRLTERVSPVLEREKAKATERAAQKRARRTRAKAEARRRRNDPIKLKSTADGMGIEAEFDRLRSLECWADWSAARAVRQTRLQVYGGRRSTASGRAWPTQNRVHVTAGAAPGWLVSKVLLHELVHIAHYERGLSTRGAGRNRYHDEAFHRMLLRAASEAYVFSPAMEEEVRREYEKAGGARRAYSMDRAIKVILPGVFAEVDREAA